MKRFVKNTVITIAMMSLGGLLGCNNMSGSHSSNGNMDRSGMPISLNRSPRPIIADIPVPRGFRWTKAEAATFRQLGNDG